MSLLTLGIPDKLQRIHFSGMPVSVLCENVSGDSRSASDKAKLVALLLREFSEKCRGVTGL